MSSAAGTHPVATGPITTPATRSLLAVDCGAIFTKAALLGVVDGRYRLLARSQVATTDATPHPDVMQGILASIADLERICARPLLREGRVIAPEQENGEGVDGVAVAVSVGGPLRLLTAGPGREALAALLQRAIGGLFAALDPLPSDVVPSADEGPQFEWERQTAHLRALHPHAVLVVGPLLEGQRSRPDIEETGRMVAAWIDALRARTTADATHAEVPVIFTGIPADGALLQSALAGHANVQVVAPLAPTTLAPLTQAMAGLYESAVLRAVPGYDGVRRLSNVPPPSMTSSLGGIVRYLSQHYQLNVVGVDVGACSTTVVGAASQGGFFPATHPTAGVGPGAGATMRATGPGNVLRWLPETVEERDLREYVLSRMLRPRLLPSSAGEIELEHALAREAIQLALRAPGSTLAGLHPLDIVLGSGGVLAHAPLAAHAALLLLDSLQPRGITSLALDVAQVAGMLGGLAAIDAVAAGQIAEGDAVRVQLASAVCTAGMVPDGQPAVRVSLEHTDGRRQVLDVMQGTLAVLPLPPGDRALLSLFPAPNVDVGLGPGQHARASDPLDGSLLGLVVDARGRPIALPRNEDERLAKIHAWRRALGIPLP